MQSRQPTAAQAARDRLSAVMAGVRPIGDARRVRSGSAQDAADTGLELLDQPRRFERRHVLVVVGLALFGIVGTWAWLARASETTVPVRVASVAPSAASSPSAAQTRAQGLLVHVVGAVRRPGVVELPAGARVAAALQSAGGLRDDADPALLNLAAPVSDGMQIVIGTKSSPGGELRLPSAGAASAEGTSKVNLNTAGDAELQTLPGVGPATAKAILVWRSQKGKFTSIDELQEIEGIGPKTFAKLSPLVTI